MFERPSKGFGLQTRTTLEASYQSLRLNSEETSGTECSISSSLMSCVTGRTLRATKFSDGSGRRGLK